MQIELAQIYEELKKNKRHADPKRLTHHGYKAYSQCDEDGIIAEIFRRIGVSNKKFVEFGVEKGTECNTVWLLLQGWSGLWIEGAKNSYNSILETHQDYIGSYKLALKCEFVTKENINQIIRESGITGSIDLLSIDVDRNDYWIWDAISAVSPRVVVIEYNATWVPPAELVVPYCADENWDGTNYFGASLAALAKLGDKKGYGLVGCSISGVNAFFVKKELLRNLFISPGDVSEHYEPARYFFVHLQSGHPTRVGPLVQL